jgi:hypothetical protein
MGIVVAGLLSAQRAEAHTSYFTGHYTLSGQNWQLVYKGPYDERSGCGVFNGVKHFHIVNHNYRQVANQGPYYFYHQRFHYVSCQQSDPARVDPTSAGAPESVEQRSAGYKVRIRNEEQRESREELCESFGLYCSEEEAGVGATEAVERLRGKVPTTVLRLTPTPFGGLGENSARRVTSASAGECVVGVLDANGMDFPRSGEFESGLTVEVGSPQVAERAGHPCS